MYEHNALGYWSGLALCLTKIRSSRARCPATALISFYISLYLLNMLMNQLVDIGLKFFCSTIMSYPGSRSRSRT